MKNFGLMAKPLTNLLKKGQQFVWTTVEDNSFKALQQTLITAPVLAMPDFSKQFILETNASDKAIGAVLQQDSHPIAYVSKALGPKAQGLSTYEKECMAMLLAVDYWRSYLQHGEFIIRTDQKSLTHLDDQRLSTPWQHKALTKLLGLSFKIQYKQGKDNRVADALSRSTHAEIHELTALSVAQPIWLQEVQDAYALDPKASQLLQELVVQSLSGHYSLKDGLIYYKSRIWFSNTAALHIKILQAFHSSPLGGHSRIEATYARVKKLFAWHNLKNSVHDFIKQCTIYQQARAERVAYPGLLEPLPIPDGAWQTVSLDFIEGLPKSTSYNYILVVVDKFSKYAHFIPLAHPFIAFQVALAYLQHVYKLHGLPKAMISDRDKVFTSNVWKELFKLLKVNLLMSSAYHPQKDGQTERVNQCLETYLRCFVHACPAKWSSWLAFAEFWYNCSYHSALGISPFQCFPKR